ncbi:MAG: TetR/AcrR family transcriptional regulator [Pseudomonadota bacterium]
MTVVEGPVEIPQADTGKPDRRTQILDAALFVFARDGFGAARTDDISKAAGTAKGTLYTYFSSKEEMFEEAVRSRLVPLVEHVQRVQEKFQGPAEDLLKWQITFLYERLVKTDLREIMRMMIAEGHRFPRLLRFYHETVVNRGVETTMRTLQYGIERGEFRADLDASAIKIIMAPTFFAAIWKMTFEEFAPLDLDKHLATHLDLILRSVKA